MADELNVKFGGDTSGLDAATAHAEQDVQSFQQKVGGLQDVLSGLGQKMQNAFSNFHIGGVNADLGQFRTATDGASEGVAGLGEAGVVAGGLIVGALVIGTQKLLEFGRANSEVAQRISNLSQQLGMTVSETSQWLAMLANAGISQETFASGVDQLSRNFAQARSGVKQQSEAFQELGIDTSQAMTQQELILAVSDRLHEMPNGPEKTAIAMRVLGRSGAELIPILNAGSEAIKAQAQAATDTGAAVGDAYVQAGLEVNDSLNQMDQATQGLSNSLFTALAPAITSVSQGMADFVTDMTSAFKAGGDLHGVIQVLDVVIRGVGIVVGAVGVVLSDVFAAAMIICIPLANSLAANVIALKRAFEGDFAGAAHAYAEAAGRSLHDIAGQIDRARAVQEHYNQYVRNTINGDNGHAAAPGLNPDQAQAGAAIISRIRAQQEADAKRVADAAARHDQQQRDAAARAARRAAEQELQAKIAGLGAEQEADRDNYDHVMELEQQKLIALQAFYGQDSRQYQQELRRKEQMERQHQQLLSQIEQDRVASHARIEENVAQTDVAIGTQRLAAQRAQIEQARQLEQITEQQRIAMLRQVDQQQEQLEAQSEDRIYQIHKTALQAQLNDESLRPQERERVLRELEELEAGHIERMRQLQENAAQDASATQRSSAAASAQSWQGILGPVGQAFNGMFQNLYNGTMGLRQAFLQALDQMLFAVVQKGIEMAVNWAANQLTMTAATTAGVTERTAAETAGAAAGMTVQGTTSLAQIMNSAWTAMAGAYSAIAGIPIIGPVLAPVSAAAAFAAVAGLAGSIVSSRGGLGSVEQDGQLAMLHKEETVLPASIAVPLRDMLSNWELGRSSAGLRAQASNGAPSGGNYHGGDTNLHYNPQAQIGGPSLEAQLKRDSMGMRRWLKNEVRNRRVKL